MAKHSHASCILFAYVYLMCSYTVNFPLSLNRQVSRELFTADLVMAQRCSNNYVNNFHFKIHKRIHTFTYIYLRRANTDTITQNWVYCVKKHTHVHMHTEGLGKKLFIFSPLFATFVLALGLSARLGVTKRKKGKTEEYKRKGPSFFFTFCKANLPPSIVVSVHFDILWIQR